MFLGKLMFVCYWRIFATNIMEGTFYKNELGHVEKLLGKFNI